MKLQHTIFILITLVCCSKKNDQILVPEAQSDVTIVDLNDVPVKIAFDSTIYIGTLQAFEGTREVYTSLYFKKEVNDKEYTRISDLLDSVVYEDEEIRRKRLPFQHAQNHFNLVGLNSVDVYNASNELLTKASLVRIEYLEDLIEGGFIAVFRLNEAVDAEDHGMYCLGETSQQFLTSNVKCVEISDPVLDDMLVKDIEIGAEDFTVKHFRLSPADIIYSLVSFDSLTYLTEFSNDSLKVLLKLKEDYYIYDIQPVALEVNGKPVLLAGFAVHESDVQWTSPLVFHNSRYVIAEEGRVR